MHGPHPIGGRTHHQPNHPSIDPAHECSILPNRISSSAAASSSLESSYPTSGHRSRSDYPCPNEKSSSHRNHTSPTSTKSNETIKKEIQWVYNPTDGSVLVDHHNQPVSVDRILATKPLRHELSTRPGPGGKKLTYLSGEGVSRTLNDVFGFDGWNLDVTAVNQAECSKDDSGRYTVVYTAQVRLTHKMSGSYKEDVGAGDATDRCRGTALSNAMKASITDAMKRAARHFGDKLGNSLYQGNFSINKAPISLQEALDKHAIERANTKFGFAKDSKNCGDGGGAATSMARANGTGIVESNQSTTTTEKMPNPPPPACVSSPPKSETSDPVCPSASMLYHRVQTQPRHSNQTEVPSLAPPPPTAAPLPPSYGRPYQHSSASISVNVACDVADGCHKMLLGSRPSLGRNNAATTSTSTTLTTNQSAVTRQAPHTAACPPPPGPMKRPPLHILPPNRLTTDGTNGAITGENKRAKIQGQDHATVGSNPYHTAAVASAPSTTASSIYPMKAGRRSF